MSHTQKDKKSQIQLSRKLRISLAVAFFVTVVFGVTMLITINNTSPMNCVTFEKESRDLLAAGESKKLVQFYKDNSNVCKLSKQTNNAPRGQVDIQNRADIYRRISLEALGVNDKKASISAAKKGMDFYRSLSPKQKEALENTAIVDDLRILEEGEW